MIYALLAFGYSVTFSTSRTINFAQGEFLMIGALVGLTVESRFHFPYLAAALGAAVIMALLELFRRRSAYGKAVTAVAADRDAASLMGINVNAVMTLSFVLSSVLAAVAGVLVAPLTLVSPTMGTLLGTKAYAVAIIGGLQSGLG